ncbi:MAG TPA: hypothetical protein VGD83_15075 [Streptosporangiaceae bacterium]
MAESDIVKQNAQGLPGGHAIKRRSTDTSEAPARERRRFGRSLPVLAGAAIAAVGLTVGSLTAASAAAGHGGPPSIEQQAAKVKAEDAFTPKNGNAEMNVNVLEDQIEHYYGSASATFPVVSAVTPARATRSWRTLATSTATCSANTPGTRSRSPTRCTTSPDPYRGPVPVRQDRRTGTGDD